MTNASINTDGYTTDPIRGVDNNYNGNNWRPEWVRLPKAGACCAWTGLSRTRLWNLLESSPIKTISLRRKGTAKGVRLIHLQSLLEYLDAQAETLGGDNE